VGVHMPKVAIQVGGNGTMLKLAFLDRDGVLVRAYPDNKTTRGPRSLEELEYLPGVSEAIDMLRRSSFQPVMVTNQPDVARGKIDRYTATLINTTVSQELRLRGWYACYHDKEDHCACRKPAPGMLYAAAVALSARLDKSIMFGDRPTDGYAAQNARIPRFYYIPTNGSLLEAVTCALAESESTFTAMVPM